MKSTMIAAEHYVAAMLLGLKYDPQDHTYYKTNTIVCHDGSFGMDIDVYDADTMEKLENKTVNVRQKLVRQGVIGCADGPNLWERNNVKEHDDTRRT